MTTPKSERTLILLRHGKAEQGDGRRDHDRALAPRGHGDARAVGRWMSDRSQTVDLDLVLCSTSERTRQTLEEVCDGGVSVKEARFDPRIYDASAGGLLDVLHEVADSVNTVLLVGHGPGVPVLAVALAQNGAGSADVDKRWTHTFPTSGVAVLGFQGSWAALAPDMAYLSAFVVPRA